MKTKIEYQGGITVPHGCETVNGLLWQVCHYNVTEDGVDCVGRATVKADTIKAVYAVLDEYQDAENLYRVYPYADGISDGEGIRRLADYAVYHVRKYALANGKAVMAELKRSIWDVEDEKAAAALAIVEALAENDALGMDELYIYARRAVERGREKLYHMSEQEYNPEWAMTNPYTQDCIKQTSNAMARLIQYAVKSACLTDKQMLVVESISRGQAQKDALAELGMSKAVFQKHRAYGLRKILTAMLAYDAIIDTAFDAEGIARTDENDIELMHIYWDTFHKCGITINDILDAEDALDEKLKKKNKNK